MNKFYFAEVWEPNTHRKATQIEADDLEDAKRIADNEQCQYGTTLELGNSIDSDGFLDKVLAVKNPERGDAWEDFIEL